MPTKNNPDTQIVLYRYINNYIRENYIPDPVLMEFSIISTTPKGFFIEDYDGKKRWVSNFHKKRYAYPTIKEALYSYIKRKNRSILISKAMVISESIRLDGAQSLFDKLDSITAP